MLFQADFSENRKLNEIRGSGGYAHGREVLFYGCSSEKTPYFIEFLKIGLEKSLLGRPANSRKCLVSLNPRLNFTGLAAGAVLGCPWGSKRVDFRHLEGGFTWKRLELIRRGGRRLEFQGLPRPGLATFQEAIACPVARVETGFNRTEVADWWSGPLFKNQAATGNIPNRHWGISRLAVSKVEREMEGLSARVE